MTMGERNSDAAVLRTLGPVALLSPSGQSIELQRKHLALLIYLRIRKDESHPRHVLERMLWWEADRPDTSLSVALNALRSHFPGIPKRTRTLRWVGDLSCDVDELLIAEMDPSRARAAVLAYGGAFLTGFRAGDGAEEFEHWKQERQAEYEERFRSLWEAQVVAGEQTGAWPEVLRLARHAARIDPYWQVPSIWMIRALGELGRPDTALRYFDRLSARLGAEDEPLVPELLREVECLRRAGPSIAERNRTTQPSDEPQISGPAPLDEPTGPATGDHVPIPASGVPGLGRTAGPIIPAVRQSREVDQTSGSRPRFISIAAAGVILAALSIAGGLFLSADRLWERSCRRGAAVGQIISEHYPAESVQSPGSVFTKAWTVRNMGKCTWDEQFYLEFDTHSEERLSTIRGRLSVPQPIAPREVYTFTVPMRTPPSPGSYEEEWVLRDAEGGEVSLIGHRRLDARVIVLPPDLPVCAPGQAVGEVVARSHHSGDRVRAGSRFDFGWSIANRGACSWAAATRLERRSYTPRSLSLHAAAPLGELVPPGTVHTFVVPMRAPDEPGAYQESWRLVDSSGSAIHLTGRTTPSARLLVTHQREDGSAIPVCAPDSAQVTFVSETFRDYAEVAPGAEFVKAWTLINKGNCTWSPDFYLQPPTRGRVLSGAGGRQLVGRFVPPQATHTFRVPMRAPAEAGVWREDLEFRDRWHHTLLVGRSSTVWTTIYVPGRAFRPK